MIAYFPSIRLITASDVVKLDDAAAQGGAGMRVWLEATEALPHIRALLTREGTGRGEVVLIPAPMPSRRWRSRCPVSST